MNINRVGVFVNATYDEVMKQVDSYGLDMVQLHGDETPRFCEQLSNYITVIKVFRLADLTQIASLSAANFGAKILAFSTDGAYLLVGSAGPTGADSWKTTDWTPGPAGMQLAFNSEMPLEQHTGDFQAARRLSATISRSSLNFTLTGNGTRYVISPGDVTLTSVKISHDGVLVAAGAQDGRVFVYQPSQNFLLQLDDTPPAPQILTPS